MKKLLLIIMLSISLVGCGNQEKAEKTQSSLPETSQKDEVAYSAAVTDLENVQINQVYRNGTCQEQGMFVIENSQLKVYKQYAPPNPNQSPEEETQLLAELGLETLEEFQELIDKTYNGCVVKVEGAKYFVKADGYAETFEKVGPNRLKDRNGVEYEVLK